MQLMSIEDLAAYLGDSKRTIYKYIASGDCPPYMRISAKNIKFDRADVDAWLESKKVFPGSGGKKMGHLSAADNARDMIRNAIGAGKLPWTPRARAVLKQAEKHARDAGADLVRTEHVVLGIVSVRECLGARVLANLGVTSSRFSELYAQLSEPSDEKGGGKGRFSEDIEKVIRCAHEQATGWGHEYIGAEHLLAGTLLARAGQGFQILSALGITLDKAREETRKFIVCHNVQTERQEQ